MYLFHAFNKQSLSSFLHLSIDEAVNKIHASVKGSRDRQRIIHLRKSSSQLVMLISKVTSIMTEKFMLLNINSVLTKNQLLKLKMNYRIYTYT